MLPPLFVELREIYAARRFGRITLAQTLKLKKRVLAQARWAREERRKGVSNG